MKKFRVALKIHGTKIITECIKSENMDTAHADAKFLLKKWAVASPEIIEIRDMSLPTRPFPTRKADTRLQ